MWLTYNRCRRSWLEGDEDDGDDGDGQAEIVFPGEFFLEEQLTCEGGEADHTDVVDGEEHHVVEATHGMIDAVGREEVDDPQTDTAEGTFPLPFRLATDEVVGHKDDTKQQSDEVDEGDHEAHVGSVVFLLGEFHQNVTSACPEKDKNG